MRKMRIPSLFLTVLLICISHAAEKTDGNEKPDSKDAAYWVAKLDNKDAVERMIAINAIADLGAKAECAIDKLLHLAVHDEKGYVSQNASRALAAIGNAAIDVIVKRLKSLDEHGQPEIYAAMLSEFGTPFLSRVSDLLKDENPVLVRACINAVADTNRLKLDPTPKFSDHSSAVIALMKSLLDHKDQSVRTAAQSVIDDIEHPKWKCCGPMYR
jgi:HEAT repeat protein